MKNPLFEAAQTLLAHRQDGGCISTLPESLRTVDIKAGYRVQQALPELPGKKPLATG